MNLLPTSGKAIASVAMAALFGSAQATVVFESVADLDEPSAPRMASFCSPCGEFLPFQVFDRFSLNVETRLTAFSVVLATRGPSGSFIPGVEGAVGFGVYEQTAMGRPGAMLFTRVFNTADLSLSSRSYTDASSFQLTLASAGFGDVGPTLQSGSYFASFFSPNADANLAVTGFSVANAQGFVWRQFGTDGIRPDVAAGFRLEGDAVSAPVPELATFGLMGLGLLCVSTLRRSRHSAHD